MNANLASHWSLDPSIIFLNHGSYGACPREVLEYQSELRARMERQPVKFLSRDLGALWEDARQGLAQFIDAPPDQLALMTNTTHAANTILRSIAWKAGDEIVTTNQEYRACRNALNFTAESHGLKLKVANLPIDVREPHRITERVLEHVSKRTRLVFIDHVVSPTSLVFPVAEIITHLNAQGVESFIDGAHAPGMLDLSIRKLAPTYYAGNCHKWMCTPKGAAFLYVRADKIAEIRPLAISHGASAPCARTTRFKNEFDWTGTQDYTPLLCITKALRVMEGLIPGGWNSIRNQNHRLAIHGAEIIAHALGSHVPYAAHSLGSMVSIPLPDAQGSPPADDRDPLQGRLYDEYQIEVPIHYWPAYPKRLIRISAQLYNSEEHYNKLAAGLQELLCSRGTF